MRPIAWIIAIVVIVAAAIWFIDEQNKSPIEEAAEDVSDAADEVADEIDDND